MRPDSLRAMLDRAPSHHEVFAAASIEDPNRRPVEEVLISQGGGPDRECTLLIVKDAAAAPPASVQSDRGDTVYAFMPTGPVSQPYLGVSKFRRSPISPNLAIWTTSRAIRSFSSTIRLPANPRRSTPFPFSWTRLRHNRKVVQVA